MPKQHVHLIISGLVQGVFFRAEAQKIAQTLNLGGWIRNVPSNEVEIYATGPRKELEKFVEWCHQGPAAAQVKNVKTDWEKGLGDFQSFKIIG